MFYTASRLVTMFVVLTFVLAPVTSHASVFDRIDAVRDRLEARQIQIQQNIDEKKEKIEHKKSKIEQKVKNLHKRVETRKEKFRSRLCDRLSNSHHYHLPAFCSGDQPEPQAPTLMFSVDPATIDVGATSTLSWESEHADECVASDGWVGTQDLSGDLVIMPTSTTKYTLTCTGAGGEVSKSATVTVVAGPAAPSVTISADPMTIVLGGTSTLSWSSLNTNTCEAHGGWSGAQMLSGSQVISPTTTSEYFLTCVGDGGTTTDSALVTVDSGVPTSTPTTTIDHLVISEVLYDLANDGKQGSESGGHNEWVEIYNPTGAPVDLLDWEIGDGSSNDVIATTSLIIDPGEFIVITNATTTALFWDFTGVTVVYLGSSISGGLANGGDVVRLFDASDLEVDAMSYGSNIDAFDPSVGSVPAGSSLKRIDETVDTDTAADWTEQISPTPGS